MGGWSHTITQNTKLTPQLVKRAIALLPCLEDDINAHLKSKGMKPIKIGKVVGSTTYVDRDLQENQNKEYGDVDVILLLPSDDLNSYLKELQNFVATGLPHINERSSGKDIIIKVDDQWVQIDFIPTPKNLRHWTELRLTPPYGIKGSVIGKLYSSLAEVLHLSIGNTGVQMKIKDGKAVSFRTQKVDEVRTISTDMSTMGLDIINALVPNAKIHAWLTRYSGMTEPVSIKRLIAMINGMIMTINMNDAWENLGFKSDGDFTETLVQAYEAKIKVSLEASKFDKAITEGAQQRAADTKDQIRAQADEVIYLLTGLD